MSMRIIQDKSGSEMGYEYRYRFWMDDDIIQRYSCFNIRADVKFVFEFRTNFRLKGCGADEIETIIDSERFEIGARSCNKLHLSWLMRPRLEDDYWFSCYEFDAFLSEASAFALQQQPRCVIPIAVELDICTVSRPGESMRDTTDRAIRSEKLFPPWLMYMTQALVNVEKPPYSDLAEFLRGMELEPNRVRFPRYFPDCTICGRSPKIGDQYTILQRYCGHYFHYHCLIGSLLTHLSCPLCCHPILPQGESLTQYAQGWRSTLEYMLSAN